MNSSQLKILSIVCAVSTVHIVLLMALSTVPSQSEPGMRPPVMLASLVAPPPEPQPVAETRSQPKPVQPVRSKSKPKPNPKPKPIPKPEPRPEPVATPPAPQPVVEKQSEVPPKTVSPASQTPETIPPRVDASGHANEPPGYPALSRRLKEEGEVILKLTILADGSVTAVRVHRSSGYPRLDKAAVKAVRQWRYLPATVGGEAIDYEYLQPMEFRLQ